MFNEDLINYKLILSAKILALFSVSGIIGHYNEIMYSIGVTFTTVYAIYNFYLLHKNKNKKN
jgi:hypothetical protein